MKLIRTADGKQKVVMKRQEWEKIGSVQGCQLRQDCIDDGIGDIVCAGKITTLSARTTTPCSGICIDTCGDGTHDPWEDCANCPYDSSIGNTKTVCQSGEIKTRC